MAGVSLDMRRAEQRVAQSFFGDGLFELLAGLMLACMGALVAIPEMGSMLYLPWLFLTVVFPAARKRYVLPRAGYVSAPGGRSRLRLTIGLAVLCLLGLAVFLLGFGDRQSPVPRAMFGVVGWLVEHAPLVAGLGMAVFFAHTGWRTGFLRLWAYAAVSLLGAIIFSLLSLRLGLRTMGLLGMVGTVMFAWGLAVFVVFLRDHPVLPEQGANPDRST